MPELPEVDAITGVVAKYAKGNFLREFAVIRGKNYGGDMTTNQYIEEVYRVGKHVIMKSTAHWGPTYIIAHNAMTGYFDWEHEPWTFDYVEGKRKSSVTDVRVVMTFADGKRLRFHDARLFGRISRPNQLPIVGPELMQTPHGMPGLPIITAKQFAKGVLSSRLPVKHLLMDQSFLAGIGNIYANEACHVAGVDPRCPGQDVPPAQVPLLLWALRCVVTHSIPIVNYDWLEVYRRSNCGTCSRPITRVEVAKRATFFCDQCQGDPCRS